MIKGFGIFIFCYAVAKKQAIQYTASVKFLPELRGMPSARWLSMLVPTGQQLTLIAKQFCGKAQDISRWHCHCACATVWLCANLECADTKAFHWEAHAITQQRGSSHQSIRSLRVLHVVHYFCPGCLVSDSSPSLIIALFVIGSHMQYKWKLLCTVLLKGPVFWCYYAHYQEKYPGHYCAGCSSFDFDSSFGLAQQTIHHWAISLSLFLVFHCVPALSFIYTLFFPH